MNRQSIKVLSIENTVTWIGFTVLWLQHTISTHHIHSVGSPYSGDNGVNECNMESWLFGVTKTECVSEKHGIGCSLECVWAQVKWPRVTDARHTSHARSDLACSLYFCLSHNLPLRFPPVLRVNKYNNSKNDYYKTLVIIRSGLVLWCVKVNTQQRHANMQKLEKENVFWGWQTVVLS